MTKCNKGSMMLLKIESVRAFGFCEAMAQQDSCKVGLAWRKSMSPT